MKFLKFLFVGIFFGIVLVKSEAISWFRIYEMFRFQSFHMYGIIGTAIATGVLFLQLSKKLNWQTQDGKSILVPKKDKGIVRYLVGGSIFGLGWGLIGACPGPIYIMVGAGYMSFIIVLIAAILGTFLYGLLRDKLPH
ncbi:MAG: YeeE/YedE thiosulfate transporter family protein [Winogradskyella sp.]